MNYGSFWGDGAERGPDFTADALHQMALSMRSFYRKETDAGKAAIAARVKREIHENGWDEETGRIRLNAAEIHAYRQLVDRYRRMFTDPGHPEYVASAVEDPEDLEALAAYFFWGAWVAGANRPGEPYSYTHNWPYDPAAGNTPTHATRMWSVLSILALFLGIGAVLYVYGQMRTAGEPFEDGHGGPRALTTPDLEAEPQRARPTQRLTYKFFAFAMVLFLLQVLAGVVVAEDFVGGGPTEASLGLLGISIPVRVARSWHLLLQIYWFFLCWIGYTLFFLPRLSRVPTGQRLLINVLFGLCVFVGAGALVGIYLGPTGFLRGELAY